MNTVVLPEDCEAVVIHRERSVVVTQPEGGTVVVQQLEPVAVVVTRGIPGPARPPGSGGPAVSAAPGNRAETGSDGGVYVRDDLVPDPLAYYILAKA